MENKSGEAKVQKVKNWSPVWIFPIVTALIGAWILFYHYSHQGPEVTLITTNAEGIEGEKPGSRACVDVGVVESATLTDDLTHVEIKARLNSGMQKLLHNDSVFWVVKPQVGREGISGLGTLLSGAYIELQPGTKGSVPAQYPLLDSPPLASPDAKGIRILLESSKAGQLSPGDPVLFRGYRVGSVETSTFDTQTSYYLPAVHQCAERSPGDHQRSFLEGQRDRCRFDLGGDARRDGLAVDAVWRRGELRYS